MMDARITAALAFAITVQTVSAVLWAGRAAQRLETVELRVAAVEPDAERLARLETRVEDITAQLDRIESKLDHLERR
jgi:hypothetical protein